MAGPFACLKFGHAVGARLGARLRWSEIVVRFAFISFAPREALQLKQARPIVVESVREFVGIRRWPIEVSARF